MRIATVDGLVTLFYDGSKEFYNQELSGEWWEEYDEHDQNDDKWEEWDLSVECKKYWRERLSWQQIIVEEGVTEIPEHTFFRCFNIKRVIMTNTVIRIARMAFYYCRSLVFCKLSINTEYIGDHAFWFCELMSVFIPPLCRRINFHALGFNKNLSILHVPRHVELSSAIIPGTTLVKHAPFEVDSFGWYRNSDDMNTWIKNINHGEAFSLHRACASFQPLKQVVFNIIQEKGLKAFKEANSAGITPSQYLKENPYTALTEKEIIHDYLMKLIG